MLEALKGLASSRKFWLVVIAVVVSLVLVLTKQIEMAEFSVTVTGLIALLVGAIGLEDAAKKFGLPPSEEKPSEPKADK